MRSMPRPDGDQRAVVCPTRFFGGQLQHRTHASRVPRGVEVSKILIFGQKLQPVLERILAGGEREFVDKTFQRETSLQRVDGAHPAQRHRSFGHHVLDRVVWNSVNRTCLVGKIGIYIVRNRLSLLSADRRRDDAMRECDRQP